VRSQISRFRHPGQAAQHLQQYGRFTHRKSKEPFGLALLSERFGPENMMFVSYTLSGALLLLTIFAGQTHQEIFFVCAAILAIFFWASLFSLFPITVGHYFGETAAGSNYGVLYAIAKGSGGLYGGILSTLLISQYRFSVAIGVAAGMAILAGLIVIPLKFDPPIWRGRVDCERTES
jgi:MFS transporter, OFA family, oxalate/formate antiporter